MITMKTLKIFFTPGGVAISFVALFYVCFVGINTLSYLERTVYWQAEHEKTLVYYQLPVCQDSKIRAQTEGKNKCDEYAVYLNTPPWRRALLDVLESNYICTDGSCSRWFNHLLTVFLLLTVGLLYALVRHTAWTVQKVTEIKNSLPVMFGQGKWNKYD